jgi:hypothetical protein
VLTPLIGCLRIRVPARWDQERVTQIRDKVIKHFDRRFVHCLLDLARLLLQSIDFFIDFVEI